MPEDKQKSAVESFLGELAEEQENPFGQPSEDPFASQETDKTIEVEEDTAAKPLPFNKDPKVLKFIEKEVGKRMAEVKPVEREVPKDTQAQDDYYERLIGNDTPEKVAMIREAKARDERMLATAEERAFNRLSQKEQEKVEADRAAEQELETAFENIEETFSVDLSSKSPVARKTRQEFVTFVEKIAPKDRNGDIIDYPDMQSAWETFSEIKKANPAVSRAKELAGRGMSRSAETTGVEKPRATWEAADAFIDSLK